MQDSLREILAESHVAPITTAVLLLDAFGAVISSLRVPATDILVQSIAPPSDTNPIWQQQKFLDSLLDCGLGLFVALAELAAAWLIARWVYGTTPLSALSRYWDQLHREYNA